MRGLLLVVLLVLAAPLAAAERWRMDHEASRLGFVATQEGDAFEGRFRELSADMRFAPDDLAGSGFDVTVNVASAETGSRQRDRALTDEEWFHADKYPRARFRTRTIERTGDGYEAVGDLTIRGTTREIVLPFTWRIDGDRARMRAEVTIDRTAYGVGQGDFADGDTVGREVTVQVDLTLHRVDH